MKIAMRAKVKCTKVTQSGETETLQFSPVGVEGPGAVDPRDCNPAVRPTPGIQLSVEIQNPEMKGKIKEGEELYIDFVRAPTWKQVDGIAPQSRTEAMKEMGG